MIKLTKVLKSFLGKFLWKVMSFIVPFLIKFARKTGKYSGISTTVGVVDFNVGCAIFCVTGCAVYYVEDILVGSTGVKVPVFNRS